MALHASWIGWIIVIGATAAAFFDLATRRIPNWLPAAMLVAAGFYHAGHGAFDIAQTFGTAGFVLVLGTYAHSRAWLGGGDVKLAVAVSAGLGFPDTASFVLFAFVSGGALALVAIAVAQRRALGAATKSFAMVFAGGALPRIAKDSLQIPYAVAIACGAALVEVGGAVPALRLFS